MTRVLVLYYSAFGHTEMLANHIAEGAGSVDQVVVNVKRIPEILPEELAKTIGLNSKHAEQLAQPAELEAYDAILFGIPTRCGKMAAQMRSFLDQLEDLWSERMLLGKIGAVFTSTGTGSDNQTILKSTWGTLTHHGMVIVGLRKASGRLSSTSPIQSDLHYGASIAVGANGSCVPTATERKLAHDQGYRVASLAKMLTQHV